MYSSMYVCCMYAEEGTLESGSRGGGWDPYCNIAIIPRMFIDEVEGECDTTESARAVETFKILRAIGIDLIYKQAYVMAKN
jgi:hypothetical protein